MKIPLNTKEIIIVSAILLLAFVLRIWGVGYGLPFVYHQDEPIVVNHAVAYGAGDFNPHFFKIPPLLSYLLFAVYGVYYALTAVFAGYTLERFAIFFFKDPTVFYLLGRLIFGVGLGTASVGILYRLGRRIFPWNQALFAAVLFAVSFLHVRDSHYVYVDIPMVFSILMACERLEDYASSGQRKSWVWACVWIGISVAFKYIAAPLIVSALWAIWMHESKEGRPMGHRMKSIVETLCLVGASYLVLNPFSVIDFRHFIREIVQQSASEGRIPFLHHLTYSLFEGHGVFATVVGFAGLAMGWKRDPTRRGLLLFPVIFYLVISVFSQEYERYAMPIIPFLCLASVYFFGGISRRFSKPAVYSAILGALFFIAAYPSTEKCLILAKHLGQVDTRTLAYQWFTENIAPGTGVVMDHAAFSPRLKQTVEQLEQKKYLVGEGDPRRQAKLKKLSLMKEAQDEFPTHRVFYLNEQALLETPFLLWSPFIEPEAEAFQRERVEYFVRYRHSGEGDFFEKKLQDKAKLVAFFSPYRTSSKIFTQDEWAHTGLPFKREELLSRKRPGPYLEIYRLDFSV